MTFPAPSGDQLARHRVGDNRQLAGLHRREDLHLRGRVSRCGLATASALAAIVAGARPLRGFVIIARRAGMQGILASGRTSGSESPARAAPAAAGRCRPARWECLPSIHVRQ